MYLDEKARDLLDNLEGDMQNEVFKDLHIPKVLFHYTDINGLNGILSTRKFWATHFKFLNDKTEILYADKLITSIIQGYINKIQDSWIRWVLEKTISTRENSLSLLDHINYDIYITSFSENGDLLDQFRAYGNDGAGYSIGVKPNELKQKKSGHVIFSYQQTELTFIKVEYNPQTQKALAEKTIEETIKTLQQIVDSNLHSQKKNGDTIIERCRQIFVQLALFYKHPSFSNEQEWRIIQAKMGNKIRDGQRAATEGLFYRNRNNIFVPYIELDFTSREYIGYLPLSQIILGPKLHENAYISLQMFLDTLNYIDAMPQIKFSELPY